MKSVITSLGMIVFAAAIVVGGTGAFFSDVETSTGNVFTAGAIDLTVDSEAHYNGSICLPDEESESGYSWQGGEEYPVGLPCSGTWEATDLGAQTFFNYDDVKPGDEGENTISLHIDNNPAWACIDVTLTKNDDVSSTEPELAVEGEDLEDPLDDFDGELAQNMKFAAWLDQGSQPGWQGKGEDDGEGDNIWQGVEAEPLLFSNQSGPASDVLGGKTYTLADSTTGTPMQPLVTNYIGLAWCAGTQAIVGDTITCDGAGMGNEAQTDSMVANIAFRVEQSRNNDTFQCNPRQVPTTGTLTLAKAVLPPEVALDTDFTLSANGPTPISGVEGAPAVTNAVVTAGVYALSEVGGPGGEISRVWVCSGNTTPEVDNGDGTATVTVAVGESVVCGITNNYPVVVLDQQE